MSEVVPNLPDDEQGQVELDKVEDSNNQENTVSKPENNAGDSIQNGKKIVYPIQGTFLAMDVWDDGTFVLMEKIAGNYYLKCSDGKEKQLENVRN